MKQELILYSTEGCHLCEMALELVERARSESTLEIVDIAFEDSLFERYGVTIPVLAYKESELNWPFNLEQLQKWLDNNGITYNS